MTDTVHPCLACGGFGGDVSYDCRGCGGTGKQRTGPVANGCQNCPACGGKGAIYVDDKSWAQMRGCLLCAGSGRVRDCLACHGKGFIYVNETSLRRRRPCQECGGTGKIPASEQTASGGGRESEGSTAR